MMPMFWEILFKIILVSAALFLLDWRIALITISLLTTPLYIPKLIEKRLQRAQKEYTRAVEDNLSRINDWLAGFEIIKNYSIEKQVKKQFQTVNDEVKNKFLYDNQSPVLEDFHTVLEKRKWSYRFNHFRMILMRQLHFLVIYYSLILSKTFTRYSHILAVEEMESFSSVV